MLAPQRPSRRRPLYFLAALISIYLFLSLGPPIFAPITVSGPLSYVDRASHWAATSLRSAAPPQPQAAALLSAQTTLSIPPSNPNAENAAPLLSNANANQQVLQLTGAGSGQESLPKIRQATVVFDGDEDGLREMYVKGLDSHHAHGERWGVPTHVLRQSIVEEAGGKKFNKLAWMMHIIMGELSKPEKERSEWVVWFDADSLILNPSIPLSLFLPPADFADKHILATHSPTGALTSSMLFLRVAPWTISTLSLALSLPSFEPSTSLPSADTSALDNILARDGVKDHVLYQPRRWWNRYHTDSNAEEKGNLLLQFADPAAPTPSGSPKTKKDLMAPFINAVATQPNDYTVPLEQCAALQTEVKEYWELLREARKALEKAKGMVQGLGKEEVLIGKMKEKDDKGRESTMKAEGGVESKFYRLVELVLRGADNAEELQLGIKALESAMVGTRGRQL